MAQVSGRRRISGWLKMTILSLLVEGPLHGYAIMKRVAENTRETWTPTPGSLYPALNELLRERLVEEREEYVGKRKRIVYRITERGLQFFLEKSREIRLRTTPSILGFLRSQVEAMKRLGMPLDDVRDLARHIDNVIEELLNIRLELASMLGDRGVSRSAARPGPPSRS